jgi:hypothetical protein
MAPRLINDVLLEIFIMTNWNFWVGEKIYMNMTGKKG